MNGPAHIDEILRRELTIEQLAAATEEAPDVLVLRGSIDLFQDGGIQDASVIDFKVEGGRPRSAEQSTTRLEWACRASRSIPAARRRQPSQPEQRGGKRRLRAGSDVWQTT